MSKLNLTESERKNILSLYGLISEQDVSEFSISVGFGKFRNLKIMSENGVWRGFVYVTGQRSDRLDLENSIVVPKSSEIGFIYDDSTKSWKPNEAAKRAIALGNMLYSQTIDGFQKGKRYIFLNEKTNTFVSSNLILRQYPKDAIQGTEIKLGDGAELLFNDTDYINQGEFSKKIMPGDFEEAVIVT